MKIRTKIAKLQMPENLHNNVNENMFHSQFYANFHMSFYEGQLKHQIGYSFTLLISLCFLIHLK